MRWAPFLLAALLTLSFLFAPPTVEAAPPKAVMTVPHDSLTPGDIRSYHLDLHQNVTEFLFHYDVTGGAEALDVIYVMIDETGDSWPSLMGEGWAYCDCRLDAGAYTVTVEADASATTPIGFNLGFYMVSEPPVEFAGFIPANSGNRISQFGVIFPSSKSYTFVLGATTGSYELFVDGMIQGDVTGTGTLSLDLTEGFHLFEVSSLALSADEDVRWTLEVQGQPKLEVTIVNPCPVLNPESGQSVCVTGAQANASDGSTPAVSYLWTATGGQFNSTNSQWVRWTAPPGVASFTLTVRASASGYVSGSDSLSVQVVPEFPSFVAPLLLTLLLSFVVLAQKRWRNSLTTR